LPGFQAPGYDAQNRKVPETPVLAGLSLDLSL